MMILHSARGIIMNLWERIDQPLTSAAPNDKAAQPAAALLSYSVQSYLKCPQFVAYTYRKSLWIREPRVGLMVKVHSMGEDWLVGTYPSVRVSCTSIRSH